ncbi:hypothetical protein D0N36_09325 [Hymenobacter lapidiphilus]|nr:hypothetical protein D0N36_09325 [Hymenobacter sp. CCM 8763]
MSHLWEARTRAAAIGGCVLSAYVMLLFYKIRLTDWHCYLVLAPVAAAGACLCLFGLRFDIRLNLRRLLDRFYLGTDPETAATDRALTARGMSGRTFARLKLLGTVVGAVLAVVLSGCKVSQPERPAPNVASSGQNVASSGQNVVSSDRNAVSSHGLPYKLTPPAPDAPAKQHRQYRRNLRAQPRTVPLVQGRAAVNAPAAT